MARKQLAVMPKEKRKAKAAQQALARHEAMEDKMMGKAAHARLEAAEKKGGMIGMMYGSGVARDGGGKPAPKTVTRNPAGAKKKAMRHKKGAKGY